MSAETSTQPPHLSGRGLLAYLKAQGVNLNTIDYPGVHIGPENQIKIRVADMLIDDTEGTLATTFAAKCPEYQNAQSHGNIPVLISLFQGFVRDVLSTTHTEKKGKIGAKKKNTPSVPQSEKPSEDLEKINEIYNNMEHALDRWSEMYGTLVKHLREYVSYLSQEYEDPNPESWHSGQDDDEDGGDIAQDDEDGEHIPNRYLDVFVRVIDTLEAKVGIIETKIERGTLQAHEYQQCKDMLDEILELTLSIKNLRWSVFESYPYEDEIILKINGLTHLINSIFDELK